MVKYSEFEVLDNAYSFWIIDCKVNGNCSAKAWTNQYHWPFDVGLPKLVNKSNSYLTHSETIGSKTKEVQKEICQSVEKTISLEYRLMNKSKPII